MMNKMCKNRQNIKKNNKYGTVLDISWNASYKVWKQTSSTK